MIRNALLLVVCINTAATGGSEGGSRETSGRIPTFESLLNRFAQMPGLEAQIREERQLMLLREPLVSDGTLYYVPPDRLARHTHTPTTSRLTVVGDQLRYANAAGAGEIDLKANPALQGFVDALRRILSGDPDRVREIFVVEYEPSVTESDPRSWCISLRPRTEFLKGMISSLELTGRDDIVSEFLIREVGGDWTKMTFSSVDPTRRFSPEEASEIFRPGLP